MCLSRSAFRPFAIVLILLGIPALSQAQDSSPDALKKAAEDAAGLRDSQKNLLTEAEKQLRAIEQALSRLKIDAERTQATVTETEAAQKKQQEESQKAATAKAEADKAADAAAKALAEAQKKADEARKSADAARQAAEKAVATATETDKKLASLKETLATTQKSLAESEKSLAAAQTTVASARSSAEQSYSEWLAKAKAVESTLKSAGQWVSFAEEVAPVFQQRCVACHNSRMAKGRLNMETYASLMAGGESGPVIAAGDLEKSDLHSQIKDGAMPKDAAPLTADQIAIVGKWISLGARLDAGVDPAAPLFRIIPKRPQPAAPATYSVAPPVTAAVFSPDGKLLATSGYHEILLWNVAERTLARRIGNMAERVFDLAFHPDGSRLAVASGTPGSLGEIKIFQTADGALVADLVTVDDAMFGVAFNVEGSRLAACGADRSVSVFDTATWKPLFRLEDHADWVLDVQWSPDGKRIVTASRDKTSKVFDAATGEAVVTFSGHGDIVYAAGFSADNNQVISAGRDKRVRVWNVADAKQARDIGGFGGEVLAMRVLPENRVLTGCTDLHVRIHQTGDAKLLLDVPGARDWIYAVDAHAGSQQGVAGTYDGELRLWNLSDGKPAGEWPARP